MMAKRWWFAMLLVLLVPPALARSPGPVQASPTGSVQGVHAFLNRDHVTLGDTVTLNIESRGAFGNPDLSALARDFQVLGTSRSSSMAIVNGKATRTAQLGIALKPLHAGTLTIPALAVGGGMTQPLTLTVGAAPSGGTGKVGDPVFMQVEVQSSSPWVGQQTIYTVRLFYFPGVDGALADPTADGARLIALDRDHRYVTARDGYTYKVIERSWALIPQRSGPISVQGPVFQGRRMGSGPPSVWLNDPNALLQNPNLLLNRPLPGFGTPVDATAPVARIDARPVPANAGNPWLPARDVQLKLTGLPANGKVDGTAPLTVTLAISASGQAAEALPEPELPPIAGARVYPDRTRDVTHDSEQWLQATRTRSFAIVPDRNGTLTIPAITLNWWDVADGRPEQARLPAHVLAVSGVAAGTIGPAPAPAPAVAATVSAAPVAAPAAAPASRTEPYGVPWRLIALASVVAWLLALAALLAWAIAWRRRRVVVSSSPVRSDADGAPGSAPTAAPDDAPADAATGDGAAPSARALQRRTLDAARAGDCGACERALLAWARAARPEVMHAGTLRAALSAGVQRDAFDALQRARWQGGDAGAACAGITHAFTRGFTWGADDGHARDHDRDALPPLYPS